MAAERIHPETVPNPVTANPGGFGVSAAKSASTAAAVSTKVFVAIGVVTVAAIVTTITLAVVLTRSTTTVCVGESAEACTASLSESLQDVTSGCEQDIGVCSSSACDGCDGYCCGAVLQSQTVTCGSDSVMFSKVDSCSCVSCDALPIAISGQVIGNCSVAGSCAMSIQLNGAEVTQSNQAGYFTFVTTYPSSGTVSFSVVGDSSLYFAQPKEVTVSREAQSYVDVQVTVSGITTSIRFDSTAGTTVDLGVTEAVSVAIPAGSLQNADGTAYTGSATVSMDLTDPLVLTDGESIDIDLSFGDQLMESDGMFKISVTADDGTQLSASGVDISVVETGRSTSLYSYDTDTAAWTLASTLRSRADTRTRNGRQATSNSTVLSATIDISAASKIYNLDALVSSYCYMKTRVFTNEQSSNQVYGATVTSLYKSQNGGWSNFLRRRAYSNGICVQVPCNNGTWSAHKVYVQAQGYVVSDTNTPSDITTSVEYTLYTGNSAFEITIPNPGGIPIRDDGPFYTSWSSCYYANINTGKYFKFVKSTTSSSSTSTTAPTSNVTVTTSNATVTTSNATVTTTSSTATVSGRVFRCQNISLDTPVFAYFDSTTSFNVSLYQLTVSGMLYNGVAIPTTDLTITALTGLHLGVFSPNEMYLHRLHNIANVLYYSPSSNVTSDQYRGSVAALAVAPYSVSISFNISGNISIKGSMYQYFIVDDVAPASIANSIAYSADVTIIPGVTASNCFTYSTNIVVLPSSSVSTVTVPSYTSPSVSTSVVYNVNISGNALICTNITLGAAALQYVDSSTAFNVSWYSITPTGFVFNGAAIPMPDITLNSITYFVIGIYNTSDGLLQQMYVDGTGLAYVEANLASGNNPQNGAIFPHPLSGTDIALFLHIAGDITIGGSSYQAFSIRSAAPASYTASGSSVTVVAGASAGGCFTP